LTGRSSRSVPTGAGSRGGQWHDAEYRRSYARAWRAANPEYRERERLRRARDRHGDDAIVVEHRVLHPAEFCACDCGCRAEAVTVCGFCREGLH
jgi:hypothetical protein